AVEMATTYGVPLRIVPTFENTPGTFISDKGKIVHHRTIKGIVCNLDEAKIALTGLADSARASAAIFGALAAANINVDMILQEGKSVPGGNSKTSQESLTFTVPRGEVDQAVALAKNHKDQIGFKEITAYGELAKI